ncbi:amidohydrolase [Kordiimonas sp. SCSIO 12610]|uniref:amidohydrolase n=1 Tax=Kordiimonas sp. SCSIO 12610 TaxID=2829597 RepID=UPI00210ED077|nr:amidohydrolase [Kordiimonas sp. SCSIO 12610]UTW54637.1 amidohydrolase [Kordiimonas sp. SCSIO 12610]
MSNEIEVFSARKIYTMMEQNPVATHVAVKDGKILKVGDYESMAELGLYTLNEQFHDKVIMPGFVEGHSHTLEGHLWQYTYVGYYDRVGPDGKKWSGLKSTTEIIGRLKSTMKDSDGPIVAWGLDPIFFGGKRISTHDLDQVTTDRPIIILHASGHCVNVNSWVLNEAGIDSETNIEGILKSNDGVPTGELRELAAMFVAFEVTGTNFFDKMGAEDDLWRFAQQTKTAGVTTATELYSPIHDGILNSLQNATKMPEFPLRLAVSKAAVTSNPEADVQRVKELANLNTDKLFFGSIKVMTDGSIQGYTARIKDESYYNGAPNGIWNAPPAEIKTAIGYYIQHGILTHIHTNGDEAIELAIDAIEAAQNMASMRPVLQHAQLITEDMIERCVENAIHTNIFSNHLYYWGDQHASYTIGPERVQMLNPAASLLKAGVTLAFHSDAPITPMAPLFTAWCAVNRMSSSGQILGSSERISVEEALYAITMGAAKTLGLDDKIGSITDNKYADFAVLDDDPYEAEPIAIKDIGITGIVVGGKIFLND